MTYTSLPQDSHRSTSSPGYAFWLRAAPSHLITLIKVCRASASSGLFSTHTRTQETREKHNKSLASLALIPTSLPHKGCLSNCQASGLKGWARTCSASAAVLKRPANRKVSGSFPPQTGSACYCPKAGVAQSFTRSLPPLQGSLRVVLLSRKPGGTGLQGCLCRNGGGLAVTIATIICGTWCRIGCYSFNKHSWNTYSVPPGRHRKVLGKVFEIGEFTDKSERPIMPSPLQLFIHLLNARAFFSPFFFRHCVRHGGVRDELHNPTRKYFSF